MPSSPLFATIAAFDYDRLINLLNDPPRIRMILTWFGAVLALVAIASLVHAIWWKKKVKRADTVALGLILILGCSLSAGAQLGISLQAEQPEWMRAPRPVLVGEPPAEQENAAALKQLRTASLIVPPPPGGAEWPCWRGPHRDGISGETGLLTDWSHERPRLVWTHPVGVGFSSMAVTGGRVYTMDYDSKSHQERVLCLDVATGEEVWVYAFPASGAPGGYAGSRSTPAVDDGKVYATGMDGLFLCLDATAEEKKGKVLWQHDLLGEYQAEKPGHGYVCSPLVDGDLVIVQPGGRKGSVVAFDRKSGKEVWSALDDPGSYSSPMPADIAGVHQIVCATGRGLVGVRASDGTPLWSYPWPTAYCVNAATPIVAGDYVFYSSGYEAGCVLVHVFAKGNDLKAEPVYVKHGKLMRNHHSTCILHDGYLYGCDSGRDDLKCIDLRTAEEKWASHSVGSKHCAIYADGHLLLINENGDLHSVEATPRGFHDCGKIAHVLRGPQCWALPALAGGWLYLRDQQKIVCLDLRKQLLARAH